MEKCRLSGKVVIIQALPLGSNELDGKINYAIFIVVLRQSKKKEDLSWLRMKSTGDVSIVA